MAGCARPPQSQAVLASYTAPAGEATAAPRTLSQLLRTTPRSPLEGRTLRVASSHEIVLNPGEVILTFDDGPRPGKTEPILDALDAHGVKGTFLMLGRAALAHPDLVREVALRGHTVGSHTFDHPNLTRLSEREAETEILAGHHAVGLVLAEARLRPSRFFRFPYLAQTALLRASLPAHDLIVLDVDVDSKDYERGTPQEVMARTLDRLERRGKGVILFHDIHARTAAMLPDFLNALALRGYSVVRLVPATDDPYERELVTAEVN